MGTSILLCCKRKRHKCRQIVPWNYSDSRLERKLSWEAGKEERRQQKVLSLHAVCAGIWKASPPSPPNQKTSPPDSGGSSDMDVWRAIHDVVWKHMEEITQPKKGRFSRSCTTSSNWILKKKLGYEDIKGSYCTTERENVFSKGKPFPCPYNFGKLISIRLTLLMIDR